MKKIDALLKKVELFERLAVYGDRKSFLQALAQQPTNWSDVARREGDLPEDHSIPAPKPIPEVNVEDLKSSIPTVPVESLSVAKPAAPAGPNVSPAALYTIQNFINKDMVNEWAPVTPDGKWGPETANRILQWGKKNNLNVGLQQLVDMLKARAMGAGVANQINPGSNLEQSKKYL
jgi:hypothetical protein